jgi:nicotinamidase-related amidase
LPAYIRQFRAANPDGKLIATLDTHTEDYLNTQEGRKLPVKHCIAGSEGWQLEPEVAEALGQEAVLLEKPTFGAVSLPGIIGSGEEIEAFQVIGICTDICVISNAMLAKAAAPEAEIIVDSKLTASFDPKLHQACLDVLGGVQVKVL